MGISGVPVPRRWTCAMWPQAGCDGFYEGQLSPWDYAAASVILEEAGGRIGTLEPYRFSFREQQPIVAGNPEVYEEIRRLSSGGRSAGDGLNQ